MEPITVIVNEATVKNNRSLKNRGQVAIELELERAQLGEALKLEAYEPGTHFSVQFTPLTQPYAKR